MCTLSWQHDPNRGSYHLFFNRDEQKTREPADPPQVEVTDGVHFISPRDRRAGGTWMLANEYGLTVALLNHYGADTPAVRPEHATSRGQLVLRFAPCPDVEAFRALVPERQAAGRYPPFFLFAIDAGGSSLWRWDGSELLEISSPAPEFLTTSSVRTAEVLGARRKAFADCDGDLASLHLQHDPDDPAASVRMRRPDAQTVSRSEVRVVGDELLFRYTPEALDDLAEQEPIEVSLPLAGAGR